MLLSVASLVLTLSTTSSTALAAEGGQHGGEHGSARSGGKEGAPAAPMKSGEHMEAHKGSWVAPKEIPHEGGVSIFGGTEHRPDGWRYRYENGGWWYWMPNNRWTYYDKGAWQDYTVGEAAVEIPVPSDPNYYWYKNQWWYSTAGNHWSYYDKGHWHDGPPGVAPPRREGVIHGEMHKDEHPSHPERPEGKKK